MIRCDECEYESDCQIRRLAEDIEGCAGHGRRKLKPCPFCGGNVRMTASGEDIIMYHFITRGKGEGACKCRVFMESETFLMDDEEGRARTQQLLITAWNRRSE